MIYDAMVKDHWRTGVGQAAAIASESNRHHKAIHHNDLPRGSAQARAQFHLGARTKMNSYIGLNCCWREFCVTFVIAGTRGCTICDHEQK